MSLHVVVGAGPVGSAIARRLAAQGDDVVVVTRSGSGPDVAGVRRVAADASDAARLTSLAVGAASIHNAANPPYHRWAADWPPLHRSLLAAAERAGAVLVTVSNLYGYGPVDGPMTEDLPLAANGTKGRVRAAMWEQALAAHDDGRLRATEVRGSDYVCPGPGSHVGDRVMPRLLAGRPVTVLPRADVAHSWTSVDDVARLAVVAATDERAWGRAWHVPSNAPRTQRELVADLCRVAGLEPVPVREHSRMLLRALGAVNPMLRELGEVAYQFERPFVLDSSAAERTFGLAPTPWDEVLEAQVAAYRGTPART
ncbi:NAD-dependent epimerase/dehydratase family protein [Cellulomonas carbonis]|uniref:NAD-dependent epimerase n=1 Tax=Cellulomonas carbonis T26 TaxID=947969 RepID=A0A0A0BUC0_9CELL|nr:NAD-dependent epimerase/dehydratase family protein [Cellulomonas carbonis]KGM11531.1 NAD-dependent epimerase [Cellulomonas carbonis T26]GGC02623.1 NAD-dependent epimerase [Cellulomonas carbonis]